MPTVDTATQTSRHALQIINSQGYGHIIRGQFGCIVKIIYKPHRGGSVVDAAFKLSGLERIDNLPRHDPLCATLVVVIC